MAGDRSQPFFGMMWTSQTRYPYSVAGRERPFSPDPKLNRYLNALREADEAFGSVMNRLKKMKILDSTLVVVVGDHGANFGGQPSQQRMLSEENLRVPCLLIHPSLKRQRNLNVGGLVDIAPTVAHVLGIAIPPGWQGESLFDAGRSNRAYFIAPGPDYVLGYREDDVKYICNATMNVTEIYDLKNDPSEQEDLGRLLPEETILCRQRFAAWVQHANRSVLIALARPKTFTRKMQGRLPGSEARRGEKIIAAKSPDRLKHVFAAVSLFPVVP
jgi:phosphoglycerol transferase MdoB-like AlkP superfamily enzyme